MALKYPEQGYVQGMAPLAATLLCYAPEEKSFVMMTRLWDRCGMKYFFLPKFQGLMSAFNELEDLLLHYDVGKVLERAGIKPAFFAPRWYLCMFNNVLPFSTQLRIWDMVTFVLDEFVVFLHAVSLTLLDGLYKQLIKADSSEIMAHLTGRINVIDDDEFMRRVQRLWNELMTTKKNTA